MIELIASMVLLAVIDRTVGIGAAILQSRSGRRVFRGSDRHHWTRVVLQRLQNHPAGQYQVSISYPRLAPIDWKAGTQCRYRSDDDREWKLSATGFAFLEIANFSYVNNQARVSYWDAAGLSVIQSLGFLPVETTTSASIRRAGCDIEATGPSPKCAFPFRTTRE